MKKVIAILMLICLMFSGAIAENNGTGADLEYTNIDAAYDEYARNPDTHKFEAIEFNGTVIQVIEDGNSCQYRVAVGGNSNNIFFVEYTRPAGESRILEDDYVTVRGLSMGTFTYQSTMGGMITIPACSADEIVGFVPSSVEISGTNDQNADGDFEVTGYPFITGNKNKLYLAITNKTARDVMLEVLVKYFDENGGLVGISNADVRAVASGTQVIVSTSNDIPFASYEYEITANDETWYACVNDQIVYEQTVVSNKVILAFTNNADLPAEFLEYTVLFMKDGNVVNVESGYATDSDSEIKPGKTQYAEEKSSAEFDEVLVFFTCRADD